MSDDLDRALCHSISTASHAVFWLPRAPVHTHIHTPTWTYIHSLTHANKNKFVVKEVSWKDLENCLRSSEFIVSPTIQLQRQKGMCCLVTIVVEGPLVKIHHSSSWPLVGSESFRGLGMFGHWWSCHISKPLQSEVSQCAWTVPSAGSAGGQAWQPGPTFCCWPVRRSCAALCPLSLVPLFVSLSTDFPGFPLGWPWPLCPATELHEHVCQLVWLHAADPLSDEARPSPL